MHKRAIGVAIMALFLLAGTVSSFACEMMCVPGMQKVSCCARMTAHCAGPFSISNARQCAHRQQDTALATPVTQALQLHMAGNHDTVLTPHLSVSPYVAGILPRDNLVRSPFIPPLRI